MWDYRGTFSLLNHSHSLPTPETSNIRGSRMHTLKLKPMIICFPAIHFSCAMGDTELGKCYTAEYYLELGIRTLSKSKYKTLTG